MNEMANGSVAAEPLIPTRPAAAPATETAPVAAPQPVTGATPVIEVAPVADAAPPTEAAKIILLEGMKVLFDEKVGLAPVQIVEKQEKLNDNGYAGV